MSPVYRRYTTGTPDSTSLDFFLVISADGVFSMLQHDVSLDIGGYECFIRTERTEHFRFLTAIYSPVYVQTAFVFI